jgi:hypothetical protein
LLGAANYDRQGDDQGSQDQKKRSGFHAVTSLGDLAIWWFSYYDEARPEKVPADL